MRVIIEPNYELSCKWSANYIARKIIKHQKNSAKPFVLGLPTGSSPIGVYRELVKLNQKKIISFKNIITFNMDEYVNLPVDHPESYHSFMWKHLFSQVDIENENINILNGNATDLELECKNYEDKIKSVGGINLFLGGVGPDGHIAFNEPGSSLSSRTRIKTLNQDTIIANSRFFNNDVSKVPTMALTVGVATILDAKEILLIVSGHTKARALNHLVEQGVNHMWTVSSVQLHPKGIVVCDDDSTIELKVGTVSYFKNIEGSNLNPDLLLQNI